MFLIDTNIHTTFLLQEFEDDRDTKKYLQFYNAIPLTQRVVPDFILGELETLIIKVIPSRYDLSLEHTKNLKKLCIEYVRVLTEQCTVFALNTASIQKATEIYLENANSHYISYVDSLILATAKEHNFTVLTKDIRLKKVARNIQVDCYEIA